MFSRPFTRKVKKLDLITMWDHSWGKREKRFKRHLVSEELVPFSRVTFRQQQVDRLLYSAH